MQRSIAFVLASLIFAAPVKGDEALVAVASNFAEVAEQLGVAFQNDSTHHLTFSAGATGSLYAQIRHGAPYDVFLAADEERPRLLEEQMQSVPGRRIVYAHGRLAFWSANYSPESGNGQRALDKGDVRTIAIANPELAPYGLAAKQTLMNLGLWDHYQPRLVYGQNIGQAYAMVATGNAEFGFVALSSILSPRNNLSRHHWDIPQSLYEPIRQQAVLLNRAKDNAAAIAFFDYLQSADARRRIVASGFGVE